MVKVTEKSQRFGGDRRELGLLLSLFMCQRDVETVLYRGKDPLPTAVAA